MTPLSTLARRASQQHDVVSVAQLSALGWSESAIRHLVRDERAIRVHRGVYLIGRRTLTQEGRWMSAVLACADRAALSHFSAAVRRELLRYDAAGPHVIVPIGTSNRGPRGVTVHRSQTLTEEDVDRENVIPTTTVLRTLADLARTRLPDHSLDAAVRQAARLHNADLQRLAHLPRLREIVRRYDPLIGLTESDLEALFLALCTRHGLPLPDPQTRFGHRRADFTWPEYGLVVECDSRDWHDNDVNFLTDRQRQRALKAAGYEVLPFTWAEIVYTPDKVAAELKRGFARRRHELRAQKAS